MSNRNARKFQHSILIEMKLIGRQVVYLTSAVRYVNIYAGGHVSKVESVVCMCVSTVYYSIYTVRWRYGWLSQMFTIFRCKYISAYSPLGPSSANKFLGDIRNEYTDSQSSVLVMNNFMAYKICLGVIRIRLLKYTSVTSGFAIRNCTI